VLLSGRSVTANFGIGGYEPSFVRKIEEEMQVKTWVGAWYVSAYLRREVDRYPGRKDGYTCAHVHMYEILNPK
jgi:hypothetical protein